MICPPISVVVPFFNGRRYLAEALDSIAEQRWESLEIIVVDDGSAEDASDIARGRDGVRWLRQEHAGVAAARNRALRESRGDWIAFLDQDDTWTPGRLSAQMNLAQGAPAPMFVTGRVRVKLEVGQAAPEWLPEGAVDRELFAYPPGTWLVHRSLFDRVGLFDTTFINASDTDWVARCIDAGILPVPVDDVVLIRRAHGANASHRTDLRRPELFRILAASVRRRRAGAEKPHDADT